MFSTLTYLYWYCGGTQAASGGAGEACGTDGQCVDVPIAPVPVCCQSQPGCGNGTAASTRQLYFFLYDCNQGRGLGSGPYMVVNASCGSDGHCAPQ